MIFSVAFTVSLLAFRKYTAPEYSPVNARTYLKLSLASGSVGPARSVCTSCQPDTPLRHLFSVSLCLLWSCLPTQCSVSLSGICHQTYGIFSMSNVRNDVRCRTLVHHQSLSLNSVELAVTPFKDKCVFVVVLFISGLFNIISLFASAIKHLNELHQCLLICLFGKHGLYAPFDHSYST